jgi:hypothetical protein
MSRYSDREEAFRIAAEKMREKREKEEREDKEFYERITSGFPWFIFKSVVVFCTLLALVTTYDYFVDGPSKKLTDKDWKIDRNWEWTWHKILDVKGYMFAPELGNWSDRVENSLELTYSPIFRTGKKLSYLVEIEKSVRVKQVEIRQRSIFTWFPVFQIFLLIPLITFILKRQNSMFNFARVASLVFVFPGSLMVIYFTLM